MNDNLFTNNSITQVNAMGSITLIIGCMFSGKSTEIMRLIKRYKILKKQIKLVKLIFV